MLPIDWFHNNYNNNNNNATASCIFVYCYTNDVMYNRNGISLCVDVKEGETQYALVFPSHRFYDPSIIWKG